MEEYVDIEEVTRQVKELLGVPGSEYYLNHMEVKKTRTSLHADITYESGRCIRVRNTSNQASANGGQYTHGTLGCFVKGTMKPISDNEQMFALSCAHVFPEGCDAQIEIARCNHSENFDLFGTLSPQFRLLKGNIADIAAIRVEDSAS